MAEIDRLVVRVLGDVTDLRRKMSKAERTVEQFGYNMTRVGRSLTVGLTLPIAAVGTAATKMASDAAEAANKFDVVMGPSADKLRKRFEELSSVIPATGAEMEGMTAGVQDLLVPMGVARGEAAEMSLSMLELGADIGSFNNVATTEVLEAFRSALAGQSRPLRRFGINVLQARLKAIALEEGLIDVGDSLDTAARAQAVLIAATRDSTDAIGDAARTADEAANQFRFFVRNMKELAITIGDQLLPVITPLVGSMNDMISAAGGLESATVRWVISLGAVAASLGPVLFIVGKAVKAFVALRVASAGLSVALGIGTGGLAFVVSGLVAGLGYLATAFVNSKLKAAAARAEYKRGWEELRENIAGAADAIRDMNEATAQLTYQRLITQLAEARSQLSDLRAEQEAAVAEIREERGDISLGQLEEMGLLPFVDEIKAAEESVRGWEETVAQAGAAVIDVMGEVGEQAGTGLAIPFDIDVSGLDLGRVLDRVDSLRDKLTRLEHDAALATTADEAESLREEIGETELALDRASRAAALLTANLPSPDVELVDSGAIEVAERTAAFQEKLDEVMATGGFDAAQIAAMRGVADEAERLEAAGESIARSLGNALVSALSSGEDAFKQFADFAIQQLLRVAAQAAILSVFRSLFNVGTFDFGGIGQDILTFQHGGYMRPGEIGIVGERGPELVQAGPQGATVTPSASPTPVYLPEFRSPDPRDASTQSYTMRILEGLEDAGAIEIRRR